MVKSPVEYLEVQDFTAQSGSDEPLTAAESLFVRKYLGADVYSAGGQAVGDDGAGKARAARLPPMPHSLVEHEEAKSIEASLRQEEQVQFVGFTLGEQLYTLPTALVQEVIRKLPPYHLPVATPHVAGVINLRGHVTPLIRLRELVEAGSPLEGGANQFTIICRCRGLQIGIQIDRVHNMYRVAQGDIQWNVEALLGGNGDCILGLFELDNKIVPIISIERIVQMVLDE